MSNSVDLSHFPRRGPREAIPRPALEKLQEAVLESLSIADALRRLGLPDSTRARGLFRAWVVEEDIATSHFLGQAHQRGKPGRNQAKSAEQVLVMHGGRYRARTMTLRRALREIGVPETCAECGTAPVWHGKPMTLEVDHVNGDWADDRAENLRLLCPNCHAVTDTWCRGGRRDRRCSE